MHRLIGIKRRNFFCVTNNQIRIVDSLPLNEIDHKSDSDSDSGWEYDVNSLAEIIEEMEVEE